MIRTFNLTSLVSRHPAAAQVFPNLDIDMSFDLDTEKFPSDAGLDFYWQHGTIPEPEVVHVMLRAIKPGDTVIDAGANVGFFTVLMSKLVGHAGWVYAFEPDWRNFEKLQRNLDLNKCTNVDLHQCALADHTGAVPFYLNAENGMSSIYGSGVADAVDMSTIAARVTHREVDFMKMDIEGSELRALQGKGDIDIPYIVTEVNAQALQKAGTTPAALIEQLEDDDGLMPFVLHENGQLPSRVWHGQELKFTKQNANMLFCTPADLV